MNVRNVWVALTERNSRHGPGRRLHPILRQTGWTKTNDHWNCINQGKAHRLASDQRGLLLYGFLTGYMTTGFKQIDGKWYFVTAKGWINRKWYYMLEDGTMVTGWLRIGDDYYFMRGDGSMATGWREMDGAWFFQETGSGL